MKKTFFPFAVAFALLSVPAAAQKSNLRAANNYLAEGQIAEAKKAIDEAAANEATANDPRTFFLKGAVYTAMQGNPALKANNPYREGMASLLKAISMGSKEEGTNQYLKQGAFYYYNDGVLASRANNNEEAFNHFGETVKIYSLDNGARFKGDKQFDTVASEARLQQILAANKMGKTTELVPMLEAAKTNPIIRQPYIYFLLAETYNKMGQADKALETFAEGKKAFPGNKDLSNGELNLYIRTGKTAEMLKKLEEAVAADGSSPELQFNLGNAYMSAAFPKSGEVPANYKELLAKAETAYTKTLGLSPNVADYQYNAGTLYYNQASELNKQMNAISGTSTADLRKADALKAQRDAMFLRAKPYFEKVMGLLETKGSSMSADDKVTYQSTLVGLREIYQRINDTKSMEAVKRKLDDLN